MLRPACIAAELEHIAIWQGATVGQNDHISTYGADLRKQADIAFRRWLFYGTVLILLHLLDIRPTQFDVLSNKLTVTSPYIVYGAISLVFFFYLYDSFTNQFVSGVINPFNIDRRIYRVSIKWSKKKGRSIKTAKNYARLNYTIYALFLMPYALCILFILLVATLLGGYDVYKLGEYIFEHSSLLKYIAESA